MGTILKSVVLFLSVAGILLLVHHFAVNSLLVACASVSLASAGAYCLWKYIFSSSSSSRQEYRMISQEENNYISPHDIQMVPTKITPTITDIPWKNTLTFMINGAVITLVNPDPTELLSHFIREKAGLKGTKLGCEEVCASSLIFIAIFYFLSELYCLFPQSLL